ncbi:hypothetical protein [Glutamicibacter sp. JC586]|uniref:hypothetical protein n=1 Tax=Glutamicibacter sp. JC586 TaxID=2590552 RepID=UPI00190F44C9|nr:hypothetical protein [Glutamicibacter sp. JC586]
MATSDGRGPMWRVTNSLFVEAEVCVMVIVLESPRDLSWRMPKEGRFASPSLLHYLRVLHVRPTKPGACTFGEPVLAGYFPELPRDGGTGA